MNPQYPVYIVSKGRWDTRLTVKALEAMNVPYYIVVEPEEYSKYKKVCFGEVLCLDETYKKNYDVFDPEIGTPGTTGPGAARNFCWDHSVANGHAWHWVLDDNIRGFGRINRNLYVPTTSGTIFKCAEDFCSRYENVALAGFNYDFFAQTRTKLPPYVLNTRIYSCLLIRNDIPFRWRGRYNEDTDLSLRALKQGWCTIQFNAFIQEKATTQTVKGGNTEEFYSHEGTLPKSLMLERMHPDVAKVAWRFKRWHHYVDYSGFKKNILTRKSNLSIPEGVNNYGMKLISVKKGALHE